MSDDLIRKICFGETDTINVVEWLNAGGASISALCALIATGFSIFSYLESRKSLNREEYDKKFGNLLDGSVTKVNEILREIKKLFIGSDDLPSAHDMSDFLRSFSSANLGGICQRIGDRTLETYFEKIEQLFTNMNDVVDAVENDPQKNLKKNAATLRFSKAVNDAVDVLNRMKERNIELRKIYKKK